MLDPEDTYDYHVTCQFCDIEVEVYIADSEPPLFCPMCGEQVDYHQFDEEQTPEEEEEDYYDED